MIAKALKFVGRFPYEKQLSSFVGSLLEVSLKFVPLFLNILVKWFAILASSNFFSDSLFRAIGMFTLC